MPIDPRVHRRLIGAKGRAIRKFMDTYKVDIRFPSLNTSDPVVISGPEDNVEEAKEQLLLLEEEYVSVASVSVFLFHVVSRILCDTLMHGINTVSPIEEVHWIRSAPSSLFQKVALNCKMPDV